MARDPEHRADSFESENTGGLLTGFLAEEDDFDRRALWRLGSWGVASVGAVIVAVLASQTQLGWRRDQVAAADLARQSQQIQSAAKETLNETRRLASAVDTLNGDRDRLYSRLTVLEQGLVSVTGSVARQNSGTVSPQAAATSAAEPASTSQNPPAPAVSAVATTAAAASPEKSPAGGPAAEAGPATVASVGPGPSNAATALTPSAPLMAPKSMMAPPDSAATRLIEPETLAKDITKAPIPDVVAALAPPDDAEQDASQASSPGLAVQRTEFGVDIGGANSVAGLRALWRGLLRSKSNAALAPLRPIIVVREAGLGMQLRLVAGPLGDAATAAKICAAMVENRRTCETTVFDGQRLAMKADEAAPPPAAAKPVAPRRRTTAKRTAVEAPAKKPEPSMLSSVFGNR